MATILTMRYLGGSVLEKQRNKLGLSLEDVAREMWNLGHNVTGSTIRNWELNDNMPGGDDLASICGVLGLSLGDIFDGRKPVAK